MNDAEDGVENALEHGEDRAKCCGDGVEDGGDEAAKVVDERRHLDCFALLLLGFLFDVEATVCQIISSHQEGHPVLNLLQKLLLRCGDYVEKSRTLWIDLELCRFNILVRL